MTRSMARYHYVEPLVRGVTLDIGCGRGYGFEVIQPRTGIQVGLDVSFEFLRDARAEHSFIPFVQATGDVLPFCSDTFDTVIAFEVIEHLKNDLSFLKELKRVARQGAFVALSTPNKLFTSGQAGKAVNPFHVCEYTATEFLALLRAVFPDVSLFGQHDGARNGPARSSLISRLIDHIPLRWKWLMPAHIQDLFSVALRPPLHLEDCRFESKDLDSAHTFVCLCSL